MAAPKSVGSMRLHPPREVGELLCMQRRSRAVANLFDGARDVAFLYRRADGHPLACAATAGGQVRCLQQRMKFEREDVKAKATI